MNINKYVILITFIPWIIFFLISGINNLNNDDYKAFSVKYLKDNFFKIFRIDTLFLIIVFYYFSSFGKEFVDKYLFAVMVLYLLMNSFYEKKEKIKKGFFKENIINLLLLLVIMVIPFSIYFIKHKLILTYKVMLFYLFFQYIIIIVVNYIAKLIKKIFKRKKIC